jgi:hypothetical protein
MEYVTPTRKTVICETVASKLHEIITDAWVQLIADQQSPMSGKGTRAQYHQCARRHCRRLIFRRFQASTTDDAEKCRQLFPETTVDSVALSRHIPVAISGVSLKPPC